MQFLVHWWKRCKKFRSTQRCKHIATHHVLNCIQAIYHQADGSLVESLAAKEMRHTLSSHFHLEKLCTIHLSCQTGGQV